jgi:hypothetical protein
LTRCAAGALVFVALVAPTATALAQRVSARAFAESLPSSASGWLETDGAAPDERRPRRDSSARSTPWAVLASAVVPGAGQAILRQDRFIAYLAIEAYAWARYAADAREGRRARATYRNLASEVARRPFSITRPVGDFDYYERMEKFAESGAFDAVPGGDLEPEPDETTANGAIWLLARETYWTDPTSPGSEAEYRNAEIFYRERAIPEAYRWSWGNARLEYAEFRRTIRRSNNAYRTSLQDLGLVIANHALSTVDAFITVRLRRHVDAAGERIELRGSIPFEP